MPHGKKSSNQRVNTKKKGRRGQAGLGTASPASSLPHNQPLFESFHASKQEPSNSRPKINAAGESLYVRYKMSTQRFKDMLQSMVPPKLFQSDFASALVDATDYIVKEDILVGKALLSNLKLSIRIRKRVALEKFGRCDEGHAYFIKILEYCWSLLAPRKKKPTKMQPSSEGESGEPSLSNRFEELAVDDDSGDEESDTEDDLPQSPQPRPATGSKRMTLQELIDGTDRTNIGVFLVTLNELMGACALQFSKLKLASEWIVKNKMPESFLVSNMMCASVAVNLAIQQVESLENAFNRDHPHLNTVYRVFAAFIMVDMVESLTGIVTKKSPLASQFTEKDAVAFIGDAMENAFRCDFKSRKSLVSSFLDRWQFPDDKPVDDEMTVLYVFDGIQTFARLETRSEFDRDDPDIQGFSSFSGIKSHEWLTASYIGSTRAITHTIRLLQMFSERTKRVNGRLVAREGAFAGGWGDLKQPVTRTQVDMDELLLGSVMPALVLSCCEGLMSNEMPHQDELLTGLTHIKNFADYPERPVSWTAAFTVHVILTAILEVHDGTFANLLATTARSAFEKFLDQLKWVEESCQAPIFRCTPCSADIKTLHRLSLLARSTTKDREEALVSCWNPYCAGAYLSYIAYFGSMDRGTLHVNSVGQLRLTLHLFNALKQLNESGLGLIVWLDQIFPFFEGCKAVWDGLPPRKGQLQTRWMKMHGYNGSMTRLLLRGPTQRDSSGMTPLALEQFSKSFCRTCLHDVHGFTDKVNKENECDTLYKLLARVKNTTNTILDDEPLLAINLISLGFVMNQFVVALFEELGFMSTIEQLASDIATSDDVSALLDAGLTIDCLKYKAMMFLFPKEILGPLEAGDTALASKCTQFMTDFFNGISHDKVQWFISYRYVRKLLQKAPPPQPLAV